MLMMLSIARRTPSSILKVHPSVCRRRRGKLRAARRETHARQKVPGYLDADHHAVRTDVQYIRTVRTYRNVTISDNRPRPPPLNTVHFRLPMRP